MPVAMRLDELVAAGLRERLVIGEQVKVEREQIPEDLRIAIPGRRRDGEKRTLERGQLLAAQFGTRIYLPSNSSSSSCVFARP